MRKIRLLLLAAVLGALVAFCPVAAWASEPLVVDAQLTTDKDVYEVGDAVSIDLNVENSDSERVESVSYAFTLPDGMVAAQGYDLSGAIGNLEPGASAEVHLEAVVEPVDEIVSLNTEDFSSDETMPQTGDGFAVGIVAIIVLAAVLVALVASKRSRNVALSMFLVLGLAGAVGASRSQSAFADQAKYSVSATKSVVVNDLDSGINAVVSFSHGSGQGGEGQEGPDGEGDGGDSSKAGVVYQDGVVVLGPEEWVEIGEDGTSIVVTPSSAERISNGTVVVALPGNGNVTGTTVKASSVSDVDDGALVVGSSPELNEVVKYINAEGSTSSLVGFELAKDVTAIRKSDAHTPSVASMRDNIVEDTITSEDILEAANLGDFDFEIVDGLVLSLDPSIDYSIHYELLAIHECRLVANADVSLTYDWKYEGPDEFRKRLASAWFSTPIPGLTVYADFSVVASVNGEVHIEATLDASAGFEYENGDFSIIAEKDLDYTASFEALLKAGVSPYVTLQLVGLNLADLTAEAGAAVEGSLIQRSDELTCADMGAWMYIDLMLGKDSGLGTVLDLLDVDLEYHPLNQDNSPRWDIHVENGAVVDECTWKEDDEDADGPLGPGDPGFGDFEDDGSVYPEYEDNDASDELQLIQESGGGNKLAEDFNLYQGSSITVTSNDNRAPTIAYVLDPGTLIRITEWDFETNEAKTEIIPWSGLCYVFEGHYGKIEVLCGRAVIYSIQSWGTPEVELGACEVIPYPLRLSKLELNMSMGDTYQLYAENDFDIIAEHENWDINDYDWESSDPDVVEVRDGRLQAVSPGAAEITVESFIPSMFWRTCVVTVS